MKVVNVQLADLDKIEELRGHVDEEAMGRVLTDWLGKITLLSFPLYFEVLDERYGIQGFGFAKNGVVDYGQELHEKPRRAL